MSTCVCVSTSNKLQNYNEKIIKVCWALSNIFKLSVSIGTTACCNRLIV